MLKAIVNVLLPKHTTQYYALRTNRHAQITPSLKIFTNISKDHLRSHNFHPPEVVRSSSRLQGSVFASRRSRFTPSACSSAFSEIFPDTSDREAMLLASTPSCSRERNATLNVPRCHDCLLHNGTLLWSATLDTPQQSNQTMLVRQIELTP